MSLSERKRPKVGDIVEITRTTVFAGGLSIQKGDIAKVVEVKDAYSIQFIIKFIMTSNSAAVGSTQHCSHYDINKIKFSEK